MSHTWKWYETAAAAAGSERCISGGSSSIRITTTTNIVLWSFSIGRKWHDGPTTEINWKKKNLLHHKGRVLIEYKRSKISELFHVTICWFAPLPSTRMALETTSQLKLYSETMWGIPSLGFGIDHLLCKGRQTESRRMNLKDHEENKIWGFCWMKTESSGNQAALKVSDDKSNIVGPLCCRTSEAGLLCSDSRLSQSRWLGAWNPQQAPPLSRAWIRSPHCNKKWELAQIHANSSNSSHLKRIIFWTSC